MVRKLTRTSFWSFRSVFPAVVEQLWGAHTMDWVHLMVDGCGGNIEDKQSHSLASWGVEVVQLAAGPSQIVWEKNPSGLCPGGL